MHHFLCQPHLADAVRKISVDSWVYDDELSKAPESELNLSLAVTKSLHLSSRGRKSLRSGLRNGSEHGFEDADLALLLCLCTNLEYIDFEIPGAMYCSLVMEILTDSIRVPPTTARPMPFRRIREAHSRDERVSMRTDVGQVNIFFELPALEVFSGEILSNKDGDRFGFDEFQTSIRDVTLYGPMLDADGVEEVLAACPKLTSFSFDCGNYDVSFDYSYTLIGNTIRKHVPNLERLAFIYDDELNSLAPNGALGTLKSLAGIKSLDLPFYGLFDQTIPLDQQQSLKDILPSSLESFTCWITEAQRKDPDMMAFLDAQLIQILSDAEFGALSTIRIDHDPMSEVDLSVVGWSKCKEERRKFPKSFWREGRDRLKSTWVKSKP